MFFDIANRLDKAYQHPWLPSVTVSGYPALPIFSNYEICYEREKNPVQCGHAWQIVLCLDDNLNQTSLTHYKSVDLGLSIFVSVFYLTKCHLSKQLCRYEVCISDINKPGPTYISSTLLITFQLY